MRALIPLFLSLSFFLTPIVAEKANEKIYVIKVDDNYIYLDRPLPRRTVIEFYSPAEEIEHPKTKKKIMVESLVGRARIHVPKGEYSLVYRKSSTAIKNGVKLGDYAVITDSSYSPTAAAAKDLKNPHQIEFSTIGYYFGEVRGYGLAHFRYQRRLNAGLGRFRFHHVAGRAAYGYGYERREVTTRTYNATTLSYVSNISTAYLEPNAAHGMVDAGAYLDVPTMRNFLFYLGLGGGLTDIEGSGASGIIGVKIGDFKRLYFNMYYFGIGDFVGRGVLEFMFPMTGWVSGILEFGSEDYLARNITDDTDEFGSNATDSRKPHAYFVGGFKFWFTDDVGLTIKAGISGRRTTQLGTHGELGLTVDF